jgi:hypothetical protein
VFDGYTTTKRKNLLNNIANKKIKKMKEIKEKGKIKPVF